MFTKILVAFDGSDYASAALDRAIELGKIGNATLFVFNGIQHYYRATRSYPIPFLSMSMDAYHMDDVAENQIYQSHKDLAERLLAAAKKKVEENGLKCETILVENSSPVEAAKELVSSKLIDLVIIGAGGVHNALSRAVLGSVSSGIANNVCSNIMIIRTGCTANHGHTTTDLPKKPQGKGKT